MSILKYFKPLPKNDEFPDPNRPLSREVSSGAIAAANQKVSETIEKKPLRSIREPYMKLTPAQRFTIGKRAAEDGTTATIRFFSTKYPELGVLKETTVRRFKNLYQDQLKVARHNGLQPEDDSQEILLKKNGRPLLVGDELDKQIREYISDLRARGAVINTSVVLASAEGIIMYRDANMLSTITLTKGWAKYLLHRMGFVKRKATSKAKVPIENFEEHKKAYLQDIKLVVSMDEISEDLVINFDQTGINYIPVSDWTMEAEGAKRVEVGSKDDKRQFTAVLAGSMTGEFLPPRLIYQGKTPRCLPQHQFPPDWHITYSINHWSNEDTMKEYIDHIILPFVNDKRKALKLSSEYPALLTFDNFKAQITPAILTLLDQNNINVVLIPPNCTD